MRHLSSCQSKQERLFHCFRSSVEPSNFDQISSYFVHSTRQQPTITASTLTAAAATFKMSTWRSNLRHRILPKYLHASDLHFRDNGHTYTAYWQPCTSAVATWASNLRHCILFTWSIYAVYISNPRPNRPCIQGSSQGSFHLQLSVKPVGIWTPFRTTFNSTPTYQNPPILPPTHKTR